jgi:hypothetical protein
MSIYDLDVGHANMKNLPVQEIPLPYLSEAQSKLGTRFPVAVVAHQ